MKQKHRFLNSPIILFVTVVVFITLCTLNCFAEIDITVPDSSLGSLKKGTWFAGLSMSLIKKDSDNPDSLIPNILTTDQERYKIDTFGGYFIKDLFAIGATYEYDFTKNEYTYIDSSRLSSRTVKKYNTIGVLTRHYLPIDDTGRFSLFVETGIDFGYGKEVREDIIENDLDRTVSKNYILDIGVTPGIMAFINKGVAIEASVNVIGFSSKWGKYSLNNGEQTGHHSSTDLDFTIDLFSLYLGVTYYF